MNLIPYILKQRIHDDERRLAFKISIASFVILNIILASIISVSYMYEYREMNQELGIESNMIDINTSIWKIIKNESLNSRGPRSDEKNRGPRDIIVFDTDQNIIKNDYLFLDETTTNTLFLLKERRNYTISINENTYLIKRKNINDSVIFFFRDLTPLRSFHLTLIVIALFGSFLGLIIIYFLARYLARITIEPIREQSRELEAYSHNVAHELRTPLSIIKSNIELLRIKPEPRFINSTDEEITGMERIIESLLFLAKPDESNSKTDINITKKTGEIVERYQYESNINYTHEKKDIIKKSNDELYTRILCNLIENAIKYKSEGDIKIQLTKNSIIVSNPIPEDLSKSEEKNIIKVFYQGDGSRHTSGYGLGLALVVKIVEILEWSMDIRTQDRIFYVEIKFSNK